MERPVIKKHLKKRSQLALEFLFKNKNFDSILDIGCGDGIHSKQFKDRGKNVTPTDIVKFYDDAIIGDYKDLQFPKHDLIWASHILEHQLNVNSFLKKTRSEVKEGGLICVTVPPLKHNIVGGHVTLWNAGLLLYNLVLAGYDCKNANICRYGYNISVIAEAKTFTLPKLNYDNGDISKLTPWLPDFCEEGFDGALLDYNWKYEDEWFNN